MNIDGLESFLSVVSNKSISKASKALHITQPTLSTRIRKLEEELDFVLLKRSWDGIELTEEGYFFLPYAIELLGELQDASFALTGDNKISYQLLSSITAGKDELRIGINIWLAPVFNHIIIPYMQEHFPHIPFKFITRPTNVLKKLLEYDSIQFSIHYENRAKTPFLCEPLLQDELVFLCHKDDAPILDGKLANSNKLDKKLIVFEHAALTNNLDKISSLLGLVQAKDYQMVDDVQNMLAFVESGHGFTVLPRSILYHISEQRMPNIVTLPIDDLNYTASVSLEYRENSQFQEPISGLTKKLKQFVQGMYKEKELSE
ncbi:LysR family transcriptional regulator [Terribacillus saccharophilus]|uniref:LysR family transcriptional regulator n=1 Tax=Terribacillus saccharophilus TaxID=361277 RepID=UPI00298A04CC|nr:LysR family transcriptional regulator [Terribacillus saccharophilus]MCM3226186.1 LysR family transcriptional regulator [Terribacillus saccharophilus]